MMMIHFGVACIIVVSTVAVFDRVDGLQCYQCTYLEGISPADYGITPQNPDANLDDSCNSGTVPKSKFLRTCREGEICHRNIAEGYLQSDKHVKVKIVDRGCIGSKAVKMETGCEKFKTLQDFRNKESAPLFFEHKLTRDTSITQCHCKKDGCNSSSQGSPTVSFLPIYLLITGLLLKLA